MANNKDCFFITQGGNGVEQWSYHGTSKQIGGRTQFDCGDQQAAKICDVFISDDGKYFAISSKESLKIFHQQADGSIAPKHFLELPVPEARIVNFSPKSRFVAVNAPLYTAEDKNLKVFDLNTGAMILETNDRRKDSLQWHPNEDFAYRLIGSELCFFENDNFAKFTRKLQMKVASYALAVNKISGCTYVAAFVKGNPSLVKVFSYPHFTNVIAQQSLFKADSCELKWNPRGDALLVMAMKDVDTTGTSYYGETSVFFLDLKGNSFMVMGKKKGSANCCEWLPSSDGFIVSAGVTPPQIQMFNLKGDVTFDFGEASVNGIYFNPFGNLLALGGFGNLAGDVFIWNMKSKTKISSFQAADTTHFAWAADGLHIVTSTHHARLKVANGFKIWDFLGNLVHTEGCKESITTPLHKTLVVPAPKGLFEEVHIPATVKGKAVVESRSAGKYIPPFMRTQKQSADMAKRLNNMKIGDNDASVPPPNIMLTANEKKIRDLEKKLKQINILKKQQADGKVLEKNQLEKLTKEEEMRTELAELKAK